MILHGTVRLSVPPATAAEGFIEPGILATFLPANSVLTRTGPTAFDFVVIKETSVVTLKLPGTLTVEPEAQGYLFHAAARHMLGGSATLSLHLGFVPDGDGCVLTYDGTLESTGLAGRLLRDRADQAKEMVEARFNTVKGRLEASHRAQSA